ncbi:MAG: flagellar biosynthesis anti-sigma factor FlgM [Campylobacterales bacterium]|nr:flagellar biosynthesis anti-sigma factor FlgM [Campylobacterales bacterium]
MIQAVQSQASVLASQVSQRSDKNEPVDIKTKETDRVTALKEQITKGTYAIDLEQTANAVAGELLG